MPVRWKNPDVFILRSGFFHFVRLVLIKVFSSQVDSPS
jgi:hypothetical protein